MGILLVYQENEGGGASTPLTPRILFDFPVEAYTDINPDAQTTGEKSGESRPMLLT
jgi:hypothetical protein